MKKCNSITRVAAAALLALTTIGATRAQAQKPPVSNGRIAGQVAAGVAGIPLGFAAGYTVGSGFRPHGSSNTGVALGFAGAVLGPAVGVHLVGTGTPLHGKFGDAVAGSAVGYASAIVLFPLVRKIPFAPLRTLATAATVFLPAVGASVAYNRSRR